MFVVFVLSSADGLITDFESVAVEARRHTVDRGLLDGNGASCDHGGAGGQDDGCCREDGSDELHVWIRRLSGVGEAELEWMGEGDGCESRKRIEVGEEMGLLLCPSSTSGERGGHAAATQPATSRARRR